MPQSEWCCLQPECRDPSTGRKRVLGRLRESGTLVLSPGVSSWIANLTTGRIEIVCPVCGAKRTFVGTHVAARTDGARRGQDAVHQSTQARQAV